MRDTIIILLKYEEPEWLETVKCAFNTDCPIIIADRSGCGNMAKAYNDAFIQNLPTILKYKYVWFVSNITFNRGVFDSLVHAMRAGFDCVHPCFKSDHLHLNHNAFSNDGPMIEVPFVEFTAPMIKVDLFNQFHLDDNMPFVGHDLDWSHRVREYGVKLYVDNRAFIDHSYLRHNAKGSDITEIRKMIRKSWEPHTTKALVDKYGPDWRNVLNYNGKV